MTEPMPNRWAGTMGKRWHSNYTQFEGMLSDVGDALLEFAQLAPGENVLDIGFGGGATALDAARLIGPEGQLVGVDISADLVQLANERAAQEGLSNARFIEADAGTVEIPDMKFDVLLSRFGVMFFEDPYAAFKNMHSLLKPGARAALAVWAPAEGNLWMSSMRDIVGKYVEMPPADPQAPGPMAFSDFAYFTDILEKSGFSEISKKDWTGSLYVGGKGANPSRAADFGMESQSAADMIAELPEDTKASIRAELLELATPYYNGSDVVMSGDVFFVTATA